MRKFYPILPFLLLFGFQSFIFPTFDIQSHIDQYEIGHKDLLIYQLVIKGVPNPSRPNLSFLPNFRIIKTYHHSQVITRSGRNTLQSYFIYVLSPQKTGLVSIPTFTINQRDKDFHTQSFIVKVLKSTPHAEKPPDKFIRTTATVTKTNVYVNEQFLYTVSLHTQKPLKSAQMLSNESFPGFWQEWFPTSTKTEGIDNTKVRRHTILKGALFPNRTGKITISPLRFLIETNARSMEDRIQILSTKPIVINVKSLPEKAKQLPVGRFSIRVLIKTKNIDINSILPVQMEISGNGNLKTIHVPKITGDSIFSSTITNIERKYQYGHNLSGRIQSDSMITFKKSGHTSIPPVTFSYFDPETGRISIARTRPHSVFISGERLIPEEILSMPESQVLQKGKDIDFVLTGSIGNPSPFLYQRKSFLVLFIFPFFLSLVLTLRTLLWKYLLKQRIHSDQNSILRRTIKKLNDIKSYEEVYDLFKNFLIKKIGQDSQSDMIELFLKKIPTTEKNNQEIQGFISIWTYAQQLKFSPSKNHKELSEKDIIYIKQILKAAEKYL